MKLQREMEIDSLEQMCDLMCGGVEKDYDLTEEYSDLLSGEVLWLTSDELKCIMDNMNEIGINTLMVQTCKDKFVVKVDDLTIKEWRKINENYRNT